MSPPPSPPGEKTVAVSLGVIHPAAATNRVQAVVFSAKVLGNIRQYTAYKLKEMGDAQARYQPGSRRWRRLESKKEQFLGQQARQLKDSEHKVSRAIVDWVVAQKASTLLVGNTLGQSVRWQLMQAHKLKDGKWLPYNLYRYLKYKAQRAGVTVAWVTQSLSGYPCPACEAENSIIKGIKYQCVACQG